jgi:hypothetical protein
MTEFIHCGKLPSSLQRVSAVAVSLPFMGAEDLEEAGSMRTSISCVPLYGTNVSELGFHRTLGNWQTSGNLCALPIAFMLPFVSKRCFDFAFWYFKNNDWIIKQEGRFAYNVTVSRSRDHICCAKAINIILYFKLSPCSECCMLSYGWFKGVWILYAI